MKYFEKSLQPKTIGNTERDRSAADAQHSTLSRIHAYQTRRKVEIAPLILEETRLKIQLDLEEEKLRSHQIKMPNPELIALQKKLRTLRGEAEPETIADTDSTADDSAYRETKAALSAIRSEIAEKETELRLAFDIR